MFFLGLSVLLFSNSALAQNLPSYLPSNGLVAWYPFNGNANDESGNGNNGTVNGATLTADRNGFSSSAYFFPGMVSNKITIPHAESLNFSSFTVSVWAKFESPWSFHQEDLIYKAPNPWSASQGWGIWVDRNMGDVPYIAGAYLGTNMDGVAALNAMGDFNQVNTWINYSMIYQNHQIVLYVNGVSVNTLDVSGEAVNTLSPLIIGGSKYPVSGAYDRIIDDVALFNRALTQEEITALYTGTPNNGGGGGSSSANPVPPGIPYQAVVRNANGGIAANAAVTSRFTLHQTTADGAVEYQETHALTTNAQGLMATVLGQGTAVQNTFAAINWANTAKFIQVEVDLGNGYVHLGTQQLMSVPFAQRAAAAGTIENGTLPIFADNAAALAGGLSVGKLYRTSTGDLKIVY